MSAENSSSMPIRVLVQVAGQVLTMEVDTGAAVSIIPETVFRTKFPRGKLQPSAVMLKTYTGEAMKVVGMFSARVQYKKQDPCELDMYVVAGSGPCLLGRSWLNKIHLDWHAIATVVKDKDLQDLWDEYQDVFANELGTMKHFKAKLAVSKEAKPKFRRARPVPFALRGKVEEALDRLESDGVITGIPIKDTQYMYRSHKVSAF